MDSNDSNLFGTAYVFVKLRRIDLPGHDCHELIKGGAMERWLPVVGYEGVYEVSDLGRLRRLFFRNRNTPRKEKVQLRRSSYGPNGRPRVILSMDGKGKNKQVYRLVLEAFVGPCPPGKQASHLDGNTRNSNLSNLIWETPGENSRRKKAHGTLLVGTECPSSKLNPYAVRWIRDSYEKGATFISMSRELGVSYQAVSNVAKGKTWRHVE